MNYIATLFPTDFPFAFERILNVKGVDEPCVCIPVRYAQMKRTAHGKPFIPLRIDEARMTPRGNSHVFRLMFANMDSLREARKLGINESKNLGNVRPNIADPSRKVNRRNMMTPISCRGSICLSDIPPQYITIDKETGKKYLQGNLLFKWMTHKDSFDHTHEICLATAGSEMHLGYFNENAEETQAMRELQQSYLQEQSPQEPQAAEDVPQPEQDNTPPPHEDDGGTIIIGGFQF